MNVIRLVAAGLLCASLFASCKKDDNTTTVPPVTAPYGRLTVSFSNEAGGMPIIPGALNYTNAAGNQYSVDLLKYYISDFTLVKADGSELKFQNHVLIDASDSASLHFTLDSVVNGDYTAVKFLLGVDSAHNHTGAQEGALDPVNGMIWSWNTGYIFFKHEGNFRDNLGATKPLVFHLGTDRALASVTVPVTKLAVAGNARKLFLKFDLNSAYASPDKIDFNVDNNHMSTAAGDVFWISSMKANLSDAFQYDKAE